MNRSSLNMEVTDIVYITAEAIVGLITVIGNGLVLAAIVKTRRLHTITNVFVGNLAIADIVVGILVAPSAALSFMGIPTNFYGCIFINCLILMFTNVSILMLLSVAFERFVAIKEPFLYHRLLSVRRAIYANICVWVVGSVLGLMPMYGWHGTYRDELGCRFTDVITYQYMVYFQFFGLVLVPLFIMLCIYIYILIIVRRHLRQTSALHNRFQQNGETSDGFHKDVRAAKMFALVILMFAIFWFPVNIFNCVSLFCGSGCYFPSEALLVAVVMSHANSSINPFLYATSNSRIKGAIKELFGIKLTPDERSSTDHNHARHVPNGSASAMDNNVFPILNGNHSSNFKDDSNPFVISHNGFRPDTNKLTSTDTNQNEDDDYETMLNSINHDTFRREASQISNSQSPNHNPQPSPSSLPSSTTTDPGYNQGTSKNKHNRVLDYMQTNHEDSQEEAYRLSTTPPLSSLSDGGQSHYRHIDTHNHRYGQCSVDMSNESFSKTGHKNSFHTNGNTIDRNNIPDSFELQGNDSFEFEYNVVGNLQACEKRLSSRKHLWCWHSSVYDAPNDPGPNSDSPFLCTSHKQNGSDPSSEIFTNRRNDNRSAETTFSSLSTASITSTQPPQTQMSAEQDLTFSGKTINQIPLTQISVEQDLTFSGKTINQVPQTQISVEQDLTFSGKTNNNANLEQQLSINIVPKSYGPFNEYGVVQIDTIEHTKL